MNANADLRVDHEGSVPVVRLSGEIDLVQANKLRARLLDVVGNEDVGLVVDLTDVRYIDSAGINVMFDIAERLAAGQLKFAVVVPDGGLVERVVTIVDLGSVAELHRTVEFAVTAIGSGQKPA
jgi:anti-anti-sigma factor